MATLLVEEADFDSAGPIVVQLTNIGFLGEDYGYDLLSQLSAGLVGFRVRTKGKQKGEESITPFFLRTEYIKEIQGLEAEFNPLAFKGLKLLQQVVVDLRHQNKLTPVELTARVMQVAPFTEFDMTLKKKR